LPDEVALPTALAAWAIDRAAAGSTDDALIMRVLDIHGVVGRWTDALVLSNAEQSAMKRLLEVYRAIHVQWWSLGVAKQKRMAATEHFDQAMLILQAVDRAKFVEVRREVSKLAATGLAPEPFLDGERLIGLGLTPGPAFSRLLEAAYDAQLEGSVKDVDDAVSLVRALMESGLPER
jgi:hypothetical protein